MMTWWLLAGLVTAAVVETIDRMDPPRILAGGVGWLMRAVIVVLWPVFWLFCARRWWQARR